MNIKAFLVDDEPKSIAILASKIERFCPNITIVGTSQLPLEAISMIEELEPDLVFLDIQMPEISGFELLSRFEKPFFEVIFATAYDHHAIEAINHSAIGYVLKPFDNEDLMKAAKRAEENINNKNALSKNLQLLENLQLSKFRNDKIMIPNRDGILFVSIQDIIHCEGVEGYTQIHLKNEKPILSSQSIGNVLKLLPEDMFFQCHKSHVINLQFIQKYLNEGYIIMENANRVPLSRSRRDLFFDILSKSQDKL